MSRVLVPDYYDKFSCKCGDCRHVCCDGWGIPIGEEEYFRLIGMTCKKDIRRRLDEAFCLTDHPSREHYAFIHPDYEGHCRMLDIDGRCLLQKGCGEESLPTICRVYPRSVRLYGDHAEICMSCSCEETVELLISDSAPMQLIERELPLPFPGTMIYQADTEKDLLRYRILALAQERSLSIAERLRRIYTAIGGEVILPEQSGTEALHSVRTFVAAFAKKSNGMHLCGERALDYLGDADDTVAYERYLTAERRLYAQMPDIEMNVDKVMANHLLYESFPFVPGTESPDKAFAAFCFSVALLKFVCVCGMGKGGNRSDFADLMAEAYRFVEHTDFYSFCIRDRNASGAHALSLFAPLI